MLEFRNKILPLNLPFHQGMFSKEGINGQRAEKKGGLDLSAGKHVFFRTFRTFVNNINGVLIFCKSVREPDRNWKIPPSGVMIEAIWIGI